MKLRKKHFSLVFLFSFAVMFPSCSGMNYYKVMKKPEKLFYKGQFKKAAELIKPHATEKGKNQLLFMMEGGYMFHAAGDFKLSNHILLKAGNIAKVVPISISKQILSLMSNERATNYKGEDFEKVLIHMYAGLNFMHLKNPDSARVEFKRVNQELQKIKNHDNQPRYKQNIMAKYLTAIAYETTGDKENDPEDWEFAYIEYKQIYKLNRKLKMVKRDILRMAEKLNYQDDVRKWRRRFRMKNNLPKDAGEIVVVFQAGQGAIKKSRGGVLRDPKFKARINLSLKSINLKQGVTVGAILVALKNAENPIPKFVKRSNAVKFLRVKVNGKTYRTTMLENIERTAIKNLKADYNRLRAKLAASIVVKAATSLAAGYAAKKGAEAVGGNVGKFAGLIGAVAGAGTAAAMFSAMKPDLRCWHTLPANLQLGRIFLPPGDYDVALEFIGNAGNVVRTLNQKVKIEKGKKTLVNKRTLF